MTRDRTRSISVCMASYNGEKYIYEQIYSILSQLKSTDELIVSDDNSDDKTIEIVRSFQDPRIKVVLNNPAKRGYTPNFENALKIAKGEYIFLSDQDDVWLKNKVNMFCDALNSADFVVSDASVTDEQLNIVINSHFEHNKVRKGFWINLAATRYTGCCMAFNQSVLNSILPFPRNYKLCPHDFWIVLVSEAFFRVELIYKPLILFRRHESNTSTGGIKKSPFSITNKLARRMYCLFHLVSIRSKAKKLRYDQRK
jgi:glycosyltransferase involved in cell wall biosynthesis